MSQESKNYFVPGPSLWPVILSTSLFLLASGFAMSLNKIAMGKPVMVAGFLMFAYLLYGWFSEVIRESLGNLYNKQVDKSFRWGMGWFIFSEVMFFFGFFGALFYARNVSLPWIADTHGLPDAQALWPGFKAMWPTAGPSMELVGAMKPWGLPAINTLLLLASGATLTWAHWGLMKDKRNQIIIGLALTILLGAIFLFLQYEEYAEAEFTIKSGIYGATFYMLTGFHGLHVTMGAIMLSIILYRVIKGHFNSHNHFGFEAVAWYWHFVDVVWLLLFVFVYWL
jgi:cytochrome c oxidase subunit III